MLTRKSDEEIDAIKWSFADESQGAYYWEQVEEIQRKLEIAIAQAQLEADQEKIKEIFEEIEKLLFECEDWETQWLLSKGDWQALKERWVK